MSTLLTIGTSKKSLRRFIELLREAKVDAVIDTRRSNTSQLAGFSKKDWYPWRYRRRLSLLSRPLVRLGDADEDKVVFAPGLVRDCVELLLMRLINGRLPAEDRLSNSRILVGTGTQYWHTPRGPHQRTPTYPPPFTKN